VTTVLPRRIVLTAVPALVFTAHGIPAPQGSKRHVGRGIIVESSDRLKPWRDTVKHAAIEAMGNRPMIDEAVYVSMTFFLPRPKTSKRRHPTTRPDLSKLVRAVEDAITDARVWRDDSLVIGLDVWKAYEDECCRPGVSVSIVLKG
jgi:Holliday junction resolvase RusA-like endonuclease